MDRGTGGLEGIALYPNSQPFQVTCPPRPQPASGTAGVVYDQHDVDAVHLQQVHQEGAVALGVQPHGPHVLRRQDGLGARGHLPQDLEDAVIQLHEEPGGGSGKSQCQLKAETRPLAMVTQPMQTGSDEDNSNYFSAGVSKHSQYKEILLVGRAVSVHLLRVQQHLPKETKTNVHIRTSCLYVDQSDGGKYVTVLDGVI